MNPKIGWLVAMVLLLAAGCAQPETRIVFFGDSITEAGAQPGGYVSLVAEELDAEHAPGTIEVIGAGISGNKVPHLQARLDEDVLTHGPTHVVIYIGINDVWHHFEFESVTGTDAVTYRDGLTAMVKTIQEAGVDVLLCTPSVIGEDTNSEAPPNHLLRDYAELTRSVAAVTGATLCDLRQAFEEALAELNPEGAYEGVLTTDGVHLNDAGNRMVADFMLEHLRQAL